MLVKDFASWRQRARKTARARRGATIFGALSLVLVIAGCGGFPGFGGASPASDAGPRLDARGEALAGMARQPSEPYWPFRLAELSAAADSIPAAVVHLKAALALNPDYAPALSLLTRIYFDSRAHAEAITLLEGTLARQPLAPVELRVALALHLDAAGERGRAEAVLAACPGDSRELRGARSYLSLRGDNVSGVLEAAERALEADRDNAVNHNNYGVALLCAGRPLEARDAFQAAIDRDATLAGALYNMAIVETFYLFNDSAGREWFARYRQHASDDPDGLASVLEADVSRLGAPKAR